MGQVTGFNLPHTTDDNWDFRTHALRTIHTSSDWLATKIQSLREGEILSTDTVLSYSVLLFKIHFKPTFTHMRLATCDAQHATATESVHTHATLKVQQLGMEQGLEY